MEMNILHTIQEWIQNPVTDAVMIFFTRLGDNGLLWILIMFFLLCRKKTRGYGILLGISLLISAVLGNLIIKPIFERLRPFFHLPEHELLIPPPGGYSFPSGHTLTAFASAPVIYAMHKKSGIAAYIVAFLIGFSRMYLYVHYPTDVLAGILLGLLCGFLTVKIGKPKIMKKAEG